MILGVKWHGSFHVRAGVITSQEKTKFLKKSKSNLEPEIVHMFFSFFDLTIRLQFKFEFFGIILVLYWLVETGSIPLYI